MKQTENDRENLSCKVRIMTEIEHTLSSLDKMLVCSERCVIGEIAKRLSLPEIAALMEFIEPLYVPLSIYRRAYISKKHSQEILEELDDIAAILLFYCEVPRHKAVLDKCEEDNAELPHEERVILLTDKIFELGFVDDYNTLHSGIPLDDILI